MKNKKYIIWLLLLVVFIWGAIIIQIIDLSEEENNINATSEIINNDVTTKEADSFTLFLSYHDPFLMNNDINLTTENELQTTESHFENFRKQSSEQNNNSLRKKPEIAYHGLVKNIASKKIIVVLNIDFQDYLLSENEVIQGIELLKIYRDSVLVKYNNEIITIKKE